MEDTDHQVRSWCVMSFLWYMKIWRVSMAGSHLEEEYEHLDEFGSWCQLVQFVFQCQLMKVQGCIMSTWTCKNVIWWHVKYQHVRMLDVNMWNVDMWEFEMLTCGMSTCENMRCWHVRVWEYTMLIFHGFENVCPEVDNPWIWEHALHDVDIENTRCVMSTLQHISSFPTWNFCFGRSGMDLVTMTTYINID